MLLRGRDTPAGMTITLRKKKLRKYDMFIYVDSFTKMPISVESAGWMPHLDISCEIEPKQNLYSGYHSVSQTHINIENILQKSYNEIVLREVFSKSNPFKKNYNFYGFENYIDTQNISVVSSFTSINDISNNFEISFSDYERVEIESGVGEIHNSYSYSDARLSSFSNLVDSLNEYNIANGFYKKDINTDIGYEVYNLELDNTNNYNIIGIENNVEQIDSNTNYKSNGIVVVDSFLEMHEHLLEISVKPVLYKENTDTVLDTKILHDIIEFEPILYSDIFYSKNTQKYEKTYIKFLTTSSTISHDFIYNQMKLGFLIEDNISYIANHDNQVFIDTYNLEVLSYQNINSSHFNFKKMDVSIDILPYTYDSFDFEKQSIKSAKLEYDIIPTISYYLRKNKALLEPNLFISSCLREGLLDIFFTKSKTESYIHNIFISGYYNTFILNDISKYNRYKSLSIENISNIMSNTPTFFVGGEIYVYNDNLSSLVSPSVYFLNNGYDYTNIIKLEQLDSINVKNFNPISFYNTIKLLSDQHVYIDVNDKSVSLSPQTKLNHLTFDKPNNLLYIEKLTSILEENVVELNNAQMISILSKLNLEPELFEEYKKHVYINILGQKTEQKNLFENSNVFLTINNNVYIGFPLHVSFTSNQSIINNLYIDSQINKEIYQRKLQDKSINVDYLKLKTLLFSNITENIKNDIIKNKGNNYFIVDFVINSINNNFYGYNNPFNKTNNMSFLLNSEYYFNESLRHNSLINNESTTNTDVFLDFKISKPTKQFYVDNKEYVTEDKKHNIDYKSYVDDPVYPTEIDIQGIKYFNDNARVSQEVVSPPPRRWLFQQEYFRPWTLHESIIRFNKRKEPKYFFPDLYKRNPQKRISLVILAKQKKKYINPKSYKIKAPRVLFLNYYKRKEPKYYKPFFFFNKQRKYFVPKYLDLRNVKTNRIIYVNLESGKIIPFDFKNLTKNLKLRHLAIQHLWMYSQQYQKAKPVRSFDFESIAYFTRRSEKSMDNESVSFFNMHFKRNHVTSFYTRNMSGIFGQGSGANGSIWFGYGGKSGNIINSFRKLSTYLDGTRGLKQDYEKAVKWIQSKRDYYELRGVNVDDALSPIQVLESKINPFNKKVIGPYIESSLIKRFNFGAKHKSIGFYREKEIPMPQFSSISRYRPQSNKIERTIDVLEYKAFKFFNQQEIPIADRRYKFATDLETSTKLPLSLKTNFLDYDARSYEISRLDIMKAKGIRNDVVYGMFGETIDYFTKKPTDGKYQIDTGTNIQVKSDPARYDEYGNYIGDGAVFVEIPIKTYALNINEDFMFEYDITYRVRKNWSLDRDEPVIEDHREDGEVNIESIESRLKYYLDQGWLSLDDYDGYITRDNNGEILVHDDLVKEIDLLSESQRFMNERELLDILGKSLKTILLERAERRRGNS